MLKKLQHKGFKKGFKRTPQRLAILEYLDGNESHPSAEEVYKAVSRKYRSMSFATVYNTLNMLVETGAIRDLTIDPDRRRYDPNTRPHHHLICVGCRKVVDVSDTIAVEVPKSIAGEFAVIGNHIEFYGYCSPCRKKKRER
jgi:Fur family peroxide stress response transcriptional regulator